MAEAGRVLDIQNNMSEHRISMQRLQQITKLIKFIITLDDLEIIKATLESIVEILDENNSNAE